MPQSEMPVDVDFTRDRRGWVYRAFIGDANAAVLEAGESFAANWLPNVVRRDLESALAQAQGSPAYDVVVLHDSLGGCASLARALECAYRLLRDGGLLLVAGDNRLAVRRPSGAPAARATGWRFRSLLRRAGFASVTLYTAHPDLAAPAYIVRADRRSAREFFRATLRARNRSRGFVRRAAIAALIELNLMPYLQPHFVVVGRKC